MSQYDHVEYNETRNIINVGNKYRRSLFCKEKKENRKHFANVNKKNRKSDHGHFVWFVCLSECL